MKVKSKRKMAGILAAVLIALVLLAFDCINGDPISERWAMHRAIQFAEKLYPDQTFYGGKRGFDAGILLYRPECSPSKARIPGFMWKRTFGFLPVISIRSTTPST